MNNKNERRESKIQKKENKTDYSDNFFSPIDEYENIIMKNKLIFNPIIY